MNPLLYFQDAIKSASNGETQGVFFLCAVYAFLMLSYSMIYQLRVSRWPSTTGTLHSETIEKWGNREFVTSNQQYKVAALYTYSVDGTTYQGKRVSPWIIIASHNARFLLKHQLNQTQKQSDNNVTIFYNPRKPSKSWLVKPGVKGMILTLILALIPMSLYLFRYHV